MEGNVDELKIALVQTDIIWEDITANLAGLEEKILALSEPFDVIILPEMFNTGFTMNAGVAEMANMKTSVWMKFIAAHTNSLVIGSLPVKEAGKIYNRLQCVWPDGKIQSYDKRHLFRMGGEHDHYAAGQKRIIVNYKGWRLCPLVCYDLRFPVWSRNSAEDGYDVLIYIANWPAKRSHAWNTLLSARAIENQSYVAGVNRVGTDGVGLNYQGDSAMVDFLGEPMFIGAQGEFIKVVSLSKHLLHQYRETFPAWADADRFRMEI